MLSIDNLTVIYPDNTVAVDGFNLHIGAGERVALVGANGSGKTTLMFAMLGILPIASGSVSVCGEELSKKTLDSVRAHLGFVFQDPDDQLFTASIYDDVAFGPRNFGLPADEVKERTEAALGELGIAHLKTRSAVKLSGGEKRMAALATVLSMRPEILLLDEPTAFLDMKARRRVIEVLNSLPQVKLISGHDLAFLIETTERAVLIKDGSIYADGATREILSDDTLMTACELEAFKA